MLVFELIFINRFTTLTHSHTNNGKKRDLKKIIFVNLSTLLYRINWISRISEIFDIGKIIDYVYRVYIFVKLWRGFVIKLKMSAFISLPVFFISINHTFCEFLFSITTLFLSGTINLHGWKISIGNYILNVPIWH